MAEEEPGQVSAAAAAPLDPIALLRDAAPWLFAAELGTCLVGSQALAHACRAAGIDGPRPMDIDLAWGLDLAAGQALLQQHGVFVPTTTGNQERGTLAMKVAGRRLEVTTFRAGAESAPLRDRILADLGERDMTIGAVAVEVATGRTHDPHHGLQHWQQRRIAPVGDAAQRVREHPIRWLRYYRKAHEFGFQLERAVRSLGLEPALLHSLPREAIALELRAVLLKCRSPGRCLLELHEDGVLTTLAPELARQFDGRPAGPQRWHPEVSQALHLILALEWAVANTTHLDERDRLTVAIAVLCHDLGKGWTPAAELPQHIGHERDGLPHVDSLLARWPGFADQRATTLARHVCALHVEVRNFAELRAGTLAELYDTWFRGKDYPVELFALAVAADSAGRLGHGDDGPRVLAQVRGDLEWLRATCSEVDATALRERFPDLAEFRRALHEARAQAIARARSRR
jgi:tRNA nucleotidyltransferase (CCA-adding enzyme)